MYFNIRSNTNFNVNKILFSAIIYTQEIEICTCIIFQLPVPTEQPRYSNKVILISNNNFVFFVVLEHFDFA